MSALLDFLPVFFFFFFSNSVHISPVLNLNFSLLFSFSCMLPLAAHQLAAVIFYSFFVQDDIPPQDSILSVLFIRV